jgi:drug/metabolite transporter (DMT)-like permease
LLPILYGLISAISWGAADFSGGLASRKSPAYQVLFLSELAGVFPLVILSLAVGDPMPSLSAWVWSGLASTVGTVGMLILYRSFAEGRMTIAAPVSALLAAVVPVFAGALMQGLPGYLTIAGFLLAFVAVWIISQDGSAANLRISLRDLRLPLISGIFFGLYFVLIHQATREAHFWPLVSARAAGTLVMLGYGLALRGPILPGRQAWRLALLAGVLDVGGNVFYVLSSQLGRLDVAAVLGALYPALTVLLAWLLLKEHISRLQTLGILLALTAIALLTL